MNYIDTMVFEHANIKRMLMVVRATLTSIIMVRKS